MNTLQRIGLIPVLFLFALSGTALAADDNEAWAPIPPRLSFIDGEVSYWREGAEDWARAPQPGADGGRCALHRQGRQLRGAVR